MRKILIHAGMSPLDRPSMDRVFREHLFTTNSGNLLFQYGAYRTMMTEDAEFESRFLHLGDLTDDFIDRINAEYECVILPMANNFRVGFNLMGNLTAFIRRLKIPCVVMGVGLQAGYTVWRQGKVSVTPMVGVNWSRLSWDLNHIKYEKDDEDKERPVIDDVTGTHESGFAFMANVDVDIKLHGKLVDYPLGGDRQAHYTSSLRISPFVTHAKFNNFNPSVKGCCIGLTVSYAGLLRSIR